MLSSLFRHLRIYLLVTLYLYCIGGVSSSLINSVVQKNCFLKLKSASSSTLRIWDASSTRESSVLITTMKPFASAIIQGCGGEQMYFTADSDPDKIVGKFIFPANGGLKVLQYPLFLNNHQHNGNRETDFETAYRARTGDTWWHYIDGDGPRPEVKFAMWPADFIGQVHTIESSEGIWSRKNDRNCQSTECVSLSLEVVSKSPKVFVIKDFLSSLEADILMESARAEVMEDSKVCEGEVYGAGVASTVRTSSHTWLNRDTNCITESIYKRAAHLLKIDDKVLNEFSNAEELQLVHYKLNQKYEPHFDWTIDLPESRYITLLLYLTDQASVDAGGETAFPLAERMKRDPSLGISPLHEDPETDGFKIHPGKGSAVLFYNLLEDGNGDIKSLHGGCTVLKGEKWLANLWVWDPKTPRQSRI